jgi:hypothetical protein
VVVAVVVTVATSKPISTKPIAPETTTPKPTTAEPAVVMVMMVRHFCCAVFVEKRKR